MIRHFIEVWLLFMAVFTIGCLIGAQLYAAVARGPLAFVQSAVANVMGDAVDEVKWRLGVGPDWRPVYRSSLWAQTLNPTLPARGEVKGIAPPSGAEMPQPAEEETGATALASVTSRGGDSPPGSDPDTSEGSVVVAEDTTMMRPVGLSAPRAGIGDNLQRIRGIGGRNEKLLHSLGIFHFGQIAAWTPAEARWIASHLAFPERVERDDWIGQAITLASGGDTGYKKSAARREDPEPDEE